MRSPGRTQAASARTSAKTAGCQSALRNLTRHPPPSDLWEDWAIKSHAAHRRRPSKRSRNSFWESSCPARKSRIAAALLSGTQDGILGRLLRSGKAPVVSPVGLSAGFGLASVTAFFLSATGTSASLRPSFSGGVGVIPNHVRTTMTGTAGARMKPIFFPRWPHLSSPASMRPPEHQWIIRVMILCWCRIGCHLRRVSGSVRDPPTQLQTRQATPATLVATAGSDIWCPVRLQGLPPADHGDKFS